LWLFLSIYHSFQFCKYCPVHDELSIGTTRLNILFWNIANHSIAKHLIRAAKIYLLDIIILAEIKDEIKRIGLARAFERIGYKWMQTPGCDKIFVLVKSGIKTVLHKQHTHYSVFHANGLNICAVHFPSKLYMSNDRYRKMSELACYSIEEAENYYGHRKSIIVGDFNMNPFDEPMISFTGARSTNHSTTANKLHTRDDERKYLFYNPSWSLYGKFKSNPGTFAYINLGENVLNWHMLDQVIIRPILSDRFNFEKFEIIRQIDIYSLVSKSGKPNVSDHLPIRFSLN